jgi:hypothetical protein
MFPGEESTQFESKSSESDGVPVTAADGVSTGGVGSGELDEGADLILVSINTWGPHSRSRNLMLRFFNRPAHDMFHDMSVY